MAEESLQSTVEEIKPIRILLLGKSGAGKSSLVNAIFGIELAEVSDSESGRAAIEQEIRSQSNRHFVLHDSRGFEPGDFENMAIVRDFIKSRGAGRNLEDKLHAIWHVVETPMAGGRVLEEGELNVIRDCGNLPIISVFTKYDLWLRSFERDFASDQRKMVEKADDIFKKQFYDRLVADIRLNHHAVVRVSTKYDQTIIDLAKITHSLLDSQPETGNRLQLNDIPVAALISRRATIPSTSSPPHVSESPSPQEKKRGFRFSLRLPKKSTRSRTPTSQDGQSNESTPSDPSTSHSFLRPNQGPIEPPGDEGSSDDFISPAAVAFAMAQRVDASLKISATIAVGRKKYWTALATSTHFPGHTLVKCLEVLVTDIVTVWNFRDPEEILASYNLKALISHLVEDLASPETPHSTPDFEKFLTFAAAAVGVAGLANPIAFPVAAGLILAKWAMQIYSETPDILRCLMAYIVDLTMIMHRLFWLVNTRGGPVTGLLLKRAIESLSEPTNPHSRSPASRIHQNIRSYVDNSYLIKHTNRNYALDEIKRLVYLPTFEPSPNYPEWARKIIIELQQESPARAS